MIAETLILRAILINNLVSLDGLLLPSLLAHHPLPGCVYFAKQL